MAVQHAMLVITRAMTDLVQIPGQDDLVVARGTGNQAAYQWWLENMRAAALGAEPDATTWQQQLAEWEAGTDVDFGKERLQSPCCGLDRAAASRGQRHPGRPRTASPARRLPHRRGAQLP